MLQLILIRMEELRFDKKDFSSGLAYIEKVMKRMNKVARHYAGHGVIDDVCLETQKDIQRAFYQFLAAMGKTQKVDKDIMERMHVLMLGGPADE